MQPSTITLLSSQIIAAPSLFALLFANVELMTFTVPKSVVIAPPISDAVLFVNVQLMISTLTRSAIIAAPPSKAPFANIIFFSFMSPEFEAKSICVSPCPSSIVEFPMKVKLFALFAILIELFPVYVPGSR